MFNKKQKRLQRSLYIICFLIFGFGYSQDPSIIDTSENKSISEKDSKEKEQILNIFFNNESLEDNNSIPESISTFSGKSLGLIESVDIDDIYKRLEHLKENIRILQLEQLRIEAIILAKERGFASNFGPQHPSNSIDISSELPINSKTVDPQLGVDPYKVVVVELISQEDAERAIKEAEHASKNKSNLPNSIPSLELASISRTQKVCADFNGDQNAFFAYICSVNPTDESTTICFENSISPPLVLSNTTGGNITSLKLEYSDRDYLLFTSNENEFATYFLFALRNNEWKPVIDSFCIHKSNLSSVITTIRVDPNHPDHLLHYYSVFDLDEVNSGKNPWKLVEESVMILDW